MFRDFFAFGIAFAISSCSRRICLIRSGNSKLKTKYSLQLRDLLIMKFNAKSKLFAALFPVSKQEQAAELVELNTAELTQVSGGVSLKANDGVVSTFHIGDSDGPIWIKN